MPNKDRPTYFGQWVSLANDEDLPPPLRGQRAFVPDFLREDFVPRPRTYRALADAQEAVGRLDATTARLPHREELAQMAQRLEARYSAELDGVITSTREALATELPGSVTPNVDERLQRYQQATAEATAVVRAGRPWDEVLLGRLSAMQTGSAYGGEMPWRQRPTWLGDPNQHDGCLIGAPPGPQLHKLTRAWCSWMNADSELLVTAKIAVGMLQLSVADPVPGSAHMARLVPTLELMRANVLQQPVLPLSGWLWQHERDHLQMVRGVVDRGDLDAWMVFVADAIGTTCRRQIHLISKLEEVCETMLAAVSRKTAIVRLVEALIARPVINLIQIADICGVTSSHATTVAKRLQDTGLAKILNPRTLEAQRDDNSHGKVIVATGIVRLLGLFQPEPSDRDGVAVA